MSKQILSFFTSPFKDASLFKLEKSDQQNLILGITKPKLPFWKVQNRKNDMHVRKQKKRSEKRKHLTVSITFSLNFFLFEIRNFSKKFPHVIYKTFSRLHKNLSSNFTDFFPSSSKSLTHQNFITKLYQTINPFA